MINPLDDDVPVSPMKKLKILGEMQNSIQPRQTSQEIKPIAKNRTQSELEFEETTEQSAGANICVDALPEQEPMLMESDNQYVIFPISHDDIWFMYKELVGHFWTPNDLMNKFDELKLDYNESKFFKFFAAFFASPDSKGHVIENFAEEFSKVIQVTEAKFFYGHQQFIQNLHYEVYNELLTKCVNNETESEKLFKLTESNYAVVSIRNWLKLWLRDSASFAQQLVVSACLHGLLFSSLDVVIDWLDDRSQKLAKENLKTNQQFLEMFQKLRYDQTLMGEFAIIMISKLKRKPTIEFINETIFQAAKLELDFLINGLHIEDYLDISQNDLLMLIDRRTKTLKKKLFKAIENKETTKKTNETQNRNVSRASSVQDENNESKFYQHSQQQKLDLTENF